MTLDTRPISIKSPAQIVAMRKAGRACAELLDHLEPLAKAGSSTESIDRAAAAYISERGWIAAPLHYAPPGHSPFPKSLCSSVNHQVCHGIPGPKALSSGDLVKIDCTVIVDGWHGDSCRGFIASPKPVSSQIAAKRLSDLTHQAMWEGIAAARPGAPLSNIGQAIERFAKKHGLGIVKDFTGHGIGERFHEAPSVKHYHDPADDTILLPGMCITVEPMLCLGSGRIQILADGWTVVTADKTLCAQWEHTIAILDSGPMVATCSAGMKPPPDHLLGLVELNL
jgi:methionyl aminopeptidase